MSKRKFLQDLPWLDLQPGEKILRSLYRNLVFTTHVAYDYCCVHGASGSGKTKMMLELGRRLSLEKEIFFVLIEGGEKVLDYCHRALNEGLRQRDLFLESPLAVLKEYFKERKKVVLLIDRAEGLTPHELSALLELKEKANQEKIGLFLYLFLDINQPNQELKSLTHYATHYTLSPINTDQLKRFVDHLHIVYGYDVKALTHLEINRLHALSYGYPGRVLKLIPPPSNPFFIWRFLTRKKIMLTIILLSLFIIVLAGIVLKKEQGTNLTPENSLEETLTAPQKLKEKASLKTEEIIVLEKEAITKPQEQKLPIQEPIQGTIQGTTQETIQDVIQKQDTELLDSSLENLSQEKNELERQASSQEEIKDNSSALFSTIKIEALKGKVPPFIDEAHSSDELEARPTPKAGQSSIEEVINPILSQEEEVSKQTRKASQVTLHSLESTQEKEEKDAPEAREQSTIPSGYYIQIFADSTEQKVKERLQGMNIPGTPFIVKEGARWVAIIGPYSNQTEAQAGLKHLPPSLRVLNLSILHSGRFNGL